MAADGGSNENAQTSRVEGDLTREVFLGEEAGRRVIHCRCPEPDCPCKGLSFTGHHVGPRTSVRRRPVPFTVLDDSLVNLLDAHRVLTTPQLIAATGAAERTLNHRLMRLRQRGLVTRARPYRDVGSAPFHWWLTPAGLRLVGHDTTTRRPNNPAPLFLAHTTAVAGLWLALREAPGIELVSWCREEAAWEEWLTSTGWSHPTRSRISPDATARLALDVEGCRGEVSAFVEVDLSTMVQDRLRAKVTRYRKYAEAGGWKGRHPHCPVLLFVTTSEQRATRFLAGIAPKKSKPSPFVVSEESAAAAADLEMVVAACAAVRRPTDAVTGLGWRTGPTTDVVALSTLLAANVAAGRRRAAREAARAAEEARDAPHQAIHDLRMNSQVLCWALGQEWAVEALTTAFATSRASRRRDGHEEWVEAHAEQVLAIDEWATAYLVARRRNKELPEPTPEALDALRRLSNELWIDQADALLADHHAARTNDPRLVLLAGRLLSGHLVGVDRLERLSTHPFNPEYHQQRLSDHDKKRRSHLAGVRAHQKRRQRKAVSDEAINAAFDAEHLLACNACGWPDAYRPKGEYCTVCHMGALAPWANRPVLAPQHTVLAELARMRAEVAR